MSQARYTPRVGEVVGYPGARRDSMSALEIQQARALKARYRCGWQVVAQMMGRSEADVRRACEAGTSSVTAMAAAVAVDVRADGHVPATPKGERAPLPALRGKTAPGGEALTVDGVKGGAAVLQAMRLASALPGFCARPTSVIAALAKITPPKCGVVLRDLRLVVPAVIEAWGEAGATRTWRLTDAGVAHLKGWRA